MGSRTWEEINDARAGRNFGWPTTEGPFNSASFPQTHKPCVRAIQHSGGTPTGCAITGGAFYNPHVPTCSRFVYRQVFLRRLSAPAGSTTSIRPVPATATQFATSISAPVDLKVGPDGSLYYLARQFRQRWPRSPGPQCTADHATAGNRDRAGWRHRDLHGERQPATTPLSYQWQKNGANIAGATSASYTTPPVTSGDNNSSLSLLVTNAAGTVTSNSGILTITSNTAPTLTILTPTAGTRYSGGTTLSFSGTGIDAEDGTLPASAFTWRIDFHHDTHTHPAMLDRVGITSGTFAIPNSGEISANVWHRLHLTVRDSGGLSTTRFLDIAPNTVVITFATSPAGLQVTLDGQPRTTPFSVTSVVGIVRALGVVSPQTSGGKNHTFTSWSDSGTATHTVPTPSANRTYTATYATSPSAPSGLRLTGE